MHQSLFLFFGNFHGHNQKRIRKGNEVTDFFSYSQDYSTWVLQMRCECRRQEATE